MELEHSSINDIWNKIEQEIESVAAETIGWKTGGSRNHWSVKECTQAKNEARIKTLKRTALIASSDYISKRNVERKLLRKKKKESENEVFVQINSLGKLRDTRKLYQRIKDVTNGYNQQPLLCKDSDGVVVKEEEVLGKMD